jgi:PIN domain nuclease of toxin-antitoxin system
LGNCRQHAAGRLELPENPFDYIQSRTADDGVTLLSVRLEHVCDAAALPRHHADPFDRLLVAQASREDLTLISHESAFRRYDVKLVDPAR